MKLLTSADIDRQFAWPIGRAERLARRGKLPHFVLPDGEIRFQWDDILALVRPAGPHPAGQDATEVPHES